MKMISKIAGVAVALAAIGYTASAQSLADAKKAIDAEQYQKAKSMLKNLTNTQSSKDENYFYLGWVYLQQDYVDSAKAVFNRGIAANPQSALNYVGIGAADRLNKDNSGAQQNFDKAISFAKKDSKPYVYIGESYLLTPADANAAITVLNKGIAVNAKDPDLYISLGNAYRAQLKSNEAYKAYSQALTLDPKSTKANVAEGVLWKFANNFDDAEAQFKKALADDPNYGPAYREWAETDARWARNVPTMASAKIKEAVEHYKQYQDLTDRSPESQLRYADFLYEAGDYKTLQQVASTLANTPNANLRAYRYLAYASYENGDYATGTTALNTFMSKVSPTRIIPLDYVYLGRAEIKNNQDSLGIMNLQKAIQLDSTQAVAYQDIAKAYYAEKKYEKAGDAYNSYITKSRQAKLTDYFNEGTSYYFAYEDQYYSTAKPKPTPDPTLLTKADSAFAYVNAKLPTPNAAATLYRAYVNDLKETDRNNIVGYAKPFYEQYIQVVTTKGVTDQDKKTLAQAYAYLGTYYEYKEKDAAKATENYTKAREYDPTNKQVQNFFAKKPGAAGKGK